LLIIDSHVHIFPDKVAFKAVEKLESISKIKPCTNGTLTSTFDKMKNSNVDAFICLNIATSPTQQTTINNAAAELSKIYESDNGKVKNKVVSLGSVHFNADDCLDELVRIKELGIKGIKLHPDYQDFMIDDSKMYKIYDLCSDLDLPIVFHSGWDCYSPNLIHASPERSARIAKQFPKLKIVLAHMGGLKMWDDVYSHLKGLENLYFDTSMSASMNLSPVLAGKIINSLPEENIFLGSDCPWEDPSISIDYVMALPITENRIEKILGLNAKSFYRI